MTYSVQPEHVPAILDIHALKARYFRYVDAKNWAGLKALFTPDATIFYPENQAEPLPLDAAMDLTAKALEGGVSIHHGHMPEIEILSPVTARGVWSMEDKIFWPSNQTSILGIEYLHGYGHYHEDYLRLDGQWLIARLKITRLWARQVKPARAVL